MVFCAMSAHFFAWYLFKRVQVMIRFICIGFGLLLMMSFLTCGNNSKKPILKVMSNRNDFEVSDSLCRGVYTGEEFNSKNGDIAHQYSNVMSKIVGDQLKKLYIEGKYSKVDFQNISMTTKGMNDGDNYVEYELVIPFIRVKEKCDAMTAFDHSGGWGHVPDIEKRKEGFYSSEKKVLVGNILEISDLKTTKEGLQEYWLQWKHVDYQSDCE